MSITERNEFVEAAQEGEMGLVGEFAMFCVRIRSGGCCRLLWRCWGLGC